MSTPQVPLLVMLCLTICGAGNTYKPLRCTCCYTVSIAGRPLQVMPITLRHVVPPSSGALVLFLVFTVHIASHGCDCIHIYVVDKHRMRRRVLRPGRGHSMTVLSTLNAPPIAYLLYNVVDLQVLPGWRAQHQVLARQAPGMILLQVQPL